VTFTDAMDHVAQVFEVIGAAVLLVGLFVSIALGVRAYRRTADGTQAYRILRQAFGGVILLGLEILVAADLVRTVAVAPTVQSVVVLGVIVLIRTVLSFSLETEIEGVAPWRRAATTGAERVWRAVRDTGDTQDPAVPADRQP
jgi:uncharacterized membrane protein